MGKVKKFTVLWPTPINVDAIARQPGESFELDSDRCTDLGIPALVANGYVKETA